MGAKRLTEQQKSYVLAMHESGASNEEIIIDTGLSRSSVFRIIRGEITIQKRKCLKMYNEGVNPVDISRELNISLRVVSRYLPEYKFVKERKPRVVKPKIEVPKVPKQRGRPSKGLPKLIVSRAKPPKVGKVYKTIPAIKAGTRPVEVWKGMTVMAPTHEPVDSVIERYRRKFNRL